MSLLNMFLDGEHKMNPFKFIFSKKKKRVTLVLSSGAAGGMAHIGVIKAIEEQGITIDAIAGTSMGALVGACYASKGSIKELEEIVLQTDWKRLVALADFNLAFMLKGFVQGEKVKELLKPVIGDVNFSDLKIPLVVTATDIATGKGVFISEGSVIDAVRASISIPVIFTPAKFGNSYYCDGGIVNPVPVNAARSMGPATLIVSNTTHDPEKKTEARKREQMVQAKGQSTEEDDIAYDEKALLSFNAQAEILIKRSAEEQKDSKKFLDGIRDLISGWGSREDSESPDIFTVMLQSIYSMEHHIATSQTKGVGIVITPAIAHIDTLEFYRGKEAISRGYSQAKKVLSKRKIIKRLK
jgi:NTE family protein